VRIGLHGGTGTDFAQESLKHWLGMRVDPVKDLHDFSQTDLKTMQGAQQFADLPKRQAQARTQVRYHADQSHTNAPLPKDLCMQIDRRFVPFLTSCAPAFENAMFDDLHRGWWRNIDHFSATRQADPTQTQITIRAHRQVMFEDVCRHGSATRPIVLRLALFLFGGWLWHIGFDKRRQRCFLLFQFFDPSKGGRSCSCVCFKASRSSWFSFRSCIASSSVMI
jgi:hypothetical protein